MMRKGTLILFLTLTLALFGADPTATDYSLLQCRGSLSPYPHIEKNVAFPDSLTPFYISHVGRHGSRFPASATFATKLYEYLAAADSLGTITKTGRRLMEVTEYVIAASDGRWGALDSLGMAEQRGIASRMSLAYPELFNNGKVQAVSSYSPRCMMSMMSFVHQLARLNNKVETTMASGRSQSPLLRPFDVDNDYLEFRKAGRWEQPYDDFIGTFLPTSAITRALGQDFPFEDGELQDAALTEYYVIAGLDAMGEDFDMGEFFTKEEANGLWAAFNLRQYLQRAASTISTVPADIASPLLLDIINGIDAAIEGKDNTTVALRFGHAETLLPLLSLMRIEGCYYMTNYFDTVRQHWHDFEIVPMAANLQVVVAENSAGECYVRFDLNECPVRLIAGDDRVYLPWNVAKDHLLKLIPMYYNF